MTYKRHPLALNNPLKIALVGIGSVIGASKVKVP